MPNKDKHLGIGLVILLIYYLVLDHFNLGQYFYFGITVFVGAVLPDILDPWTKEKGFEHRGVWHSTNLFVPLLVVGGVSAILMFFFPQSTYLLFFVLGYLSHLVADSKFIGNNIMGKSWSRGLPSYPTFYKGIRERYNL